MSNVEFPLLVEEGFLYVALDYIGFRRPIGIFFFFLYDVLNLIQRQTHLDPVPPIRVLSRLYDPGIVLLSRIVLLLIWLLDVFASFVIILKKLVPTVILKSVFYVKGQRKIVENVLIDGRVVVAHGVEKSLLVSNHIIVYQMVLELLVADLWWSDHLLVFETLLTIQQSLVWFLFEVYVSFEIALKLWMILRVENTPWFHIFWLLLLLWGFVNRNRFTRILFIEVNKLFKLRPYEISLLNFISDCEPDSSLDETYQHGGVVTPANKSLESMLILQRGFYKHCIRKIHFPNQVSVVISLKRQTIEKLFSSLELNRRVWVCACLLWKVDTYLLDLGLLLFFIFIIYFFITFIDVKTFLHIIVLSDRIVLSLLVRF